MKYNILDDLVVGCQGRTDGDYGHTAQKRQHIGDYQIGNRIDEQKDGIVISKEILQWVATSGNVVEVGDAVSAGKWMG